MNYRSFTNFTASLERICNDLSYTNENTVLIISELNNVKQVDKIILKDLLTVDNEDHPDTNVIMEGIQTDFKKSSPRPMSVTVVPTGHTFCRMCQSSKLSVHFVKDISKGCESCRKIQRLRYNSSVSGKLIMLLGGAKKKTKERNATEGRMSTICTVTINDMWSQLQFQRGKCYLSQKNMTFDAKSKFYISLERKDKRKGYTKENICFIALELQSADRTVMVQETETTGSAGWSREKFNEFRKQVLFYNPNFSSCVDQP